MELDMYKDNVTVIDNQEERQDALGDMPDWDSMSYEEIIKESYYWKKNTEGTFTPRPCEWKDGNQRVDHDKTNKGDDLVTISLRRMAATQKSLLKCGISEETINGITAEMELEQAIDHVMKDKRAAFVQDCLKRQNEIVGLKKLANLEMAEYRSDITMKELSERVIAFAQKVRSHQDTSFDYRAAMINKAVEQGKNLTKMKVNKAVEKYINRQAWLVVTGKDCSDPETAAQTIVAPTKAIIECTDRYLSAIKGFQEGSDSENKYTVNEDEDANL